MAFLRFLVLLFGSFGSLAVCLHLAMWRLNGSRRKLVDQVGNSDFLQFRDSFVICYVFCLFSDSLQSPYLYYLYQSYGFLESQVAILYSCGFVTSLVCSLVVPYLAQTMERKMLCLCYVAIASTSCFLKVFSDYSVLLLSRLMDGLAGSLLVVAFTEWYLHEHIETNDFPKEWLQLTFKRVALLAGCLAVVAGFMAEAAEAALHLTAAPFLLAIPCLIFAGAWISKSWNTNRFRVNSRPGFVVNGLAVSLQSSTSSSSSYSLRFGSACTAIGSSANIFLLSAIQSLFESVIYLLAFLWTPLLLFFARLVSGTALAKMPLGFVYACMMMALLCGTLTERLAAKRFSVVNLLLCAIGLSCASILAVVVAIHSAISPRLEELSTASSTEGGLLLQCEFFLIGLCVYQFAVGLYFPAMQKLQNEILPAENRSVILALFRIPLNAIACVGLLLLHGHDNQTGNWMILVLCLALTVGCLTSSALLRFAVQKRSSFSSSVTDLALSLDNTDE